MVEWGSVAAYGALALSTYNFLHGLREPARARQRETRAEFLDLLYSVQQDLDDSLKKVGFSEDAPAGPPESFEALQRDLPRISGVLKSPDPLFFKRLQTELNSIESYWREFGSVSESKSDFYSEKYRRSTETRLRDEIKDALPVIKRNYEVNNKIAGGIFISAFRYRFITWQ